MALEFVKSRFGQEVIDSLCERFLERSQRSVLYTYLLAMELAQKLAVLRILGPMPLDAEAGLVISSLYS
jgi:hypothetical protein